MVRKAHMWVVLLPWMTGTLYLGNIGKQVRTLIKPEWISSKNKSLFCWTTSGFLDFGLWSSDTKTCHISKLVWLMTIDSFCLITSHTWCSLVCIMIFTCVVSLIHKWDLFQCSIWRHGKDWLICQTLYSTFLSSLHGVCVELCCPNNLSLFCYGDCQASLLSFFFGGGGHLGCWAK